MTSFADFALNKQLLTAIEEQGYTQPTQIQSQAIPMILQGHDVLGIAQTGTGKTAAYLLPLLMKIKYAQGHLPRCLILAPTRELIMQIHEELIKLSKYTDIRSVAIYGGLGPKTQIEAIEKGVDIILATPGRFTDLYSRGVIVPKNLQYMILDEADKMMDMGFFPQIRKILEVIPRKRKNLLFSATFPPKVEVLSEEFLEAPVRIEVTPQATTAETITQSLYRVPNFRTKINLLAHIFETEKPERALIFTRSKSMADNVFHFLERKVVGAGKIRVIHANKGQNTRINAMEAFKSRDLEVLVSTDVAARGIDVRGVSHVINFDVPLIYEDYVHRIGRTGRANLSGIAITFVTMAEEYHVKKIEKIIQMEIPEAPFPTDVQVTETPFDERQEMLKEIDNQRKKEDPTFLGAFHEKKKRPAAKPKAKKATAQPRKKR